MEVYLQPKLLSLVEDPPRLLHAEDAFLAKHVDVVHSQASVSHVFHHVRKLFVDDVIASLIGSLTSV